MSQLYSNRSNARRAAIASGLAADAFEIVEKGDKFGFRAIVKMVALATEDDDLGQVAAADAKDIALEQANELGCTVYLRDPVSDTVIDKVTPDNAPKAKAKAIREKTAKAAKQAKAKKAPAEKNDAAPSGMVAEIIKLACRAKGVTPAELNELTNWKGAPWKWLMSNPKGTGFADRWGYTLETVRDGRAVTYKMTKAA